MKASPVGTASALARERGPVGLGLLDGFAAGDCVELDHGAVSAGGKTAVYLPPVNG
jgi:hypothetical protein